MAVIDPITNIKLTTKKYRNGAVDMIYILSELKRITKKHPVLTAVGLTIWIWYGSYHIGVGVGEFVANITK